MASQAFEVHGGFCLPSGNLFDQSNDFSYTGSVGYEATPQVSLFKNDIRIWGTDP